MKNKKLWMLAGILLGFIALVHAENTITKPTGNERVEPVGNMVWFIREMRYDSLLCSADTAGICYARSVTYEQAEVVSVDPSIPLENVKEAHEKSESILGSTFDKRQQPSAFTDYGLTYLFPLQERFIHYDPDGHRMIPLVRTVQVTELNISSILAIVLLGIMAISWAGVNFTHAFETYVRYLVITGTIIMLLAVYCSNLFPSEPYLITGAYKTHNHRIVDAISQYNFFAAIGFLCITSYIYAVIRVIKKLNLLQNEPRIVKSITLFIPLCMACAIIFLQSTAEIAWSWFKVLGGAVSMVIIIPMIIRSVKWELRRFKQKFRLKTQ